MTPPSSRAHVLQARDRYNKEGKTCPICAKRLSYEQRRLVYCSRLCSAQVTARRHPIRLCTTCGVARAPSNRKRCKGCSSKGAPRKPLSELLHDEGRKRFLLRDQGCICQICQLTNWMGVPIPLELDHIDGNSDNNLRENIRLVCPNCHALTPTYKGRNRGKAGKRGQLRRKL